MKLITKLILLVYSGGKCPEWDFYGIVFSFNVFL